MDLGSLFEKSNWCFCYQYLTKIKVSPYFIKMFKFSGVLSPHISLILTSMLAEKLVQFQILSQFRSSTSGHGMHEKFHHFLC